MSKQILVVDDSEIERMLLRRLLADEYAVIEAASGEEGLAELNRNSSTIAAVLLDLMMPGMDGFEVLTEMKSTAVWQQIPVIVTTSLTDDEAREQAFTLGANAYVTKPFNQTILRQVLGNTIRLCESSAITNALRRDKLTGLYNRDAFFIEARKLIDAQEPGYYMLSCFDVDSFKVINDQYGTDTGDAVLRHIAKCINSCVSARGGICARFMADKFAVLYPYKYKDSKAIYLNHRQTLSPSCIERDIRIRIGRYRVTDKSIAVSAMYDRAAIAENAIKGRYDVYISEFDESMRSRLLNEQQVINEMHEALDGGQFEAWYQPQYNHATGALIGAEALVRWRHPKDGLLVPPGNFIPAFERNGFIYELDKYMWEQVCILLRQWIDQGREPLPISINISRRDVFQDDFFTVLTGLVSKYDIPIRLLRLEITESAFAESTKTIISIVNALIDYGFTVEIDDFGSGYSSLNTLKDVPASIIKLDMKFLESTGDRQRSGNIIASVVRMAKWLDMDVIAEGVERLDQAEYLKTVGCYYVQGYLYAKPMPREEYEALCIVSEQEAELSRLEMVENLDNSAFWDPQSMDTLIFNNYVGGACIFEYYEGRTEILRYNDRYRQLFSGPFEYDFRTSRGDAIEYLDGAGKAAVMENIKMAIAANGESTCEVRLANGESVMYLRVTVRLIARVGVRYLFYCAAVDVTAQRLAEEKEKELSARISAIMDNLNSGISAVVMEGANARLLFANDRFYGLLGYTREQFDSELSDFFDGIYPADRERVAQEAAHISVVRQPLTTNYRVVRRDGAIRWMQSCVSVTTLPGVDGPVQLAVLSDVTAERENELKMGELLNAIPGGVVIYRVGTSIETLYSSAGVAKLTGISEDEYEIWRNGDIIATAIYKEDAPSVREQIFQAVAEDRPVNMTFRLNHVNGRTVQVVFSASMIRQDGQGKIYYGIFTKPVVEDMEEVVR